MESPQADAVAFKDGILLRAELSGQESLGEPQTVISVRALLMSLKCKVALTELLAVLEKSPSSPLPMTS